MWLLVSFYRKINRGRSEKALRRRDIDPEATGMEINKKGPEEQNVLTRISEGERQEESVEKKKKKRHVKTRNFLTGMAITPNENQDRLERCPRYYEAESSHDLEKGKNSGFMGLKLKGVGNPNASGHKKRQKCKGAGERNASKRKNFHKRKLGDTFSNKKHWTEKKPRKKWEHKSVEEILRNERKTEIKLRMTETGRKVSNEKIKRKMLLQARQARARGLCCE